MRLLFDENLSPRLVTLLAEVFPGSESVLTSGLGGNEDSLVRAYAAGRELAIVTKDVDFVEGLFLFASVKVIWLRLGNCTTEAAHLVMRNSIDRIAAFAASDDLVLELP
jgi:predicted nuclease of predicted toxin-antitoxin system